GSPRARRASARTWSAPRGWRKRSSSPTAKTRPWSIPTRSCSTKARALRSIRRGVSSKNVRSRETIQHRYHVALRRPRKLRARLEQCEIGSRDPPLTDRYHVRGKLSLITTVGDDAHIARLTHAQIRAHQRITRGRWALRQ